MRVGRGAGRVATIRLGHVARIAAQEVHAASANGDAFALGRFFQSFVANLQPAPGTSATTPITTATTVVSNRDSGQVGHQGRLVECRRDNQPNHRDRLIASAMLALDTEIPP